MSPEETSLQSVLAGIGGGRLRVLSLPMKGGVCAEVPTTLAVDDIQSRRPRAAGLSFRHPEAGVARAPDAALGGRPLRSPGALTWARFTISSPAESGIA